MDNIVQAMMGAAGQGGGLATDPNFNQTVLLLHGDGTNGAQNNTFLDSSTNNFTITRNGNTTQGTFSPFSNADGEWGNYFDGSGDYLDMAPGAIGTGDFTLECWVYFNSLASNQGVLDTRDNSNTNGFALTGRSTGEISMADGTSLIGTAASISANTWIHVAASRASGVLSFYVNGTRSGSTLANTTNFSNNRLRAGAIGSAGENFAGYISNARLLNSAIYSGTTITVPSSPFSDDANTTALFCQSNRFVDNATPPSTITVNGNPSVQPFSPFAPSAAYSASVNGGSGYFDGTGDFLAGPTSNTAFDMGSGNWTVETWAYPQSLSSTMAVFIASDSANERYALGVRIATSGAIEVYQWGGSSYYLNSTSTTGVVKVNAWNHIVAVRSGSDYATFVNGTRVATVSSLSGTQVSNYLVGIGQDPYAGGTIRYNGYFSSMRVVKGTAVYDPTQTTITMPTAPLTAVSGTSLLLNYTNAGIFDNTGKNNLETVGNAQIDTTTVKYGTGSLEFDGTGDYLIMKDTPNLAFGTGDFTIEMWVRFNVVNAYQMLYDGRPAGTDGAYNTLFLDQTTGKLVYYVSSAARITSTNALVVDTFYHVAVCRSGTSTKMFIDGTQTGSTYTDSTNYILAANRPVIGANGTNLTAFIMNGFIDDLRITKGVARYTSAFTPPTAAFPDL